MRPRLASKNRRIEDPPFDFAPRSVSRKDQSRAEIAENAEKKNAAALREAGFLCGLA
jgi:hypothetical protein